MPSAIVEYIAISVADLEAQLAFYSAAFGVTELEATLELPDTGIRTAIVSAPDGLRVELIERHGSRVQPAVDVITRTAGQGFTHVALRVDDLAAAVAAVRRAGGAVHSEPAAAQRPGVRFSYVADPEGNLLELIERVDHA